MFAFLDPFADADANAKNRAESPENTGENTGENSGGNNGETPIRFAPAPPQGGARLPLGRHPWNTGGKPGRSGRRPRSEAEKAWRALPDDAKRAEIVRLFDNPEGHESLRRLLEEIP